MSNSTFTRRTTRSGALGQSAVLLLPPCNRNSPFDIDLQVREQVKSCVFESIQGDPLTLFSLGTRRQLPWSRLRCESRVTKKISRRG